MSHQHRRMRRSALAALLFLGAAPVLAQSPAATAAAQSEAQPAVQEVIVTGSRIPQANLTSVSPIDIIGAQEIKQNGFTDVHSLMDLLPQNFQNGQSDLGANQNPLTSAGGVRLGRDRRRGELRDEATCWAGRCTAPSRRSFENSHTRARNAANEPRHQSATLCRVMCSGNPCRAAWLRGIVSQARCSMETRVSAPTASNETSTSVD